MINNSIYTKQTKSQQKLEINRKIFKIQYSQTIVGPICNLYIIPVGFRGAIVNSVYKIEVAL